MSVLLTLLVEMPFNNIKSILIDGKAAGQSLKESFYDVNANVKDKEILVSKKKFCH